MHFFKVDAASFFLSFDALTPLFRLSSLSHVKATLTMHNLYVFNG